MITLDAFVTAIQGAILGANQALMNQNEKLLETYFEAVEPNGTPINPPINLDQAIEQGKDLHPRTVKIDYPVDSQDASGNPTTELIKIDVPLITLVPLNMSQIDKAILTNHYKMSDTDNDGVLEVDLTSSKEDSTGSLEITLCPHEVAQGMRLVVEGYDAILKRQIPH